MTRTLSAMAALLAAGLIALTGCAEQPAETEIASADGDAKSSAEASPTPTLDREEQALKYVECMRKNGVDMPDPGPNGSIQMKMEKADQAKMEKAQEACRQYAPSKLSGGQMDPKQAERVRAFAQCMRDQGIDMPDPDPNNPGMIKLNGEGQDPEKLEAAQQACSEHLQAPPAGN